MPQLKVRKNWHFTVKLKGQLPFLQSTVRQVQDSLASPSHHLSISLSDQMKVFYLPLQSLLSISIPSPIQKTKSLDCQIQPSVKKTSTLSISKITVYGWAKTKNKRKYTNKI